MKQARKREYAGRAADATAAAVVAAACDSDPAAATGAVVEITAHDDQQPQKDEHVNGSSGTSVVPQEPEEVGAPMISAPDAITAGGGAGLSQPFHLLNASIAILLFPALPPLVHVLRVGFPEQLPTPGGGFRASPPGVCRPGGG